MSKTLLSVSGNKAITYLLKTTLSGSYNFISTDNIYSAVNELKTNDSIVLVIADIDSPQTEHWSFIHHVKTSSLYQIPVIFLTSDQDTEVSKKITDAGADGLFHKPFNPTELVKSIQQILTDKTDNKPINISSI